MTSKARYDYQDLQQDDIALIGICSDHNSSFMRGPAKAPPLIREALYCGAANLSSENGISIHADDRLKDLGDKAIAETENRLFKYHSADSTHFRSGSKAADFRWRPRHYLSYR